MYIYTLVNNIINREIVFSNKIQCNEELKNYKLEIIENVSKSALMSCINSICSASLCSAVFHTIQYSPSEKKVYFYFKGNIEKCGWNNPDLKVKIFSKVLEDIKNIFTMEKNKCVDNISLYDIERLLSAKRKQLELQEKQITNKIAEHVKNNICVPDNSLVVVRFRSNSNELSISLYNKYSFENDKTIIFNKENGKIYIKQSTINFGQHLFNKLLDDLSVAYEEKEKIYYFYDNKKLDIKTVNSDFYVDSFFSRTQLCLNIPHYYSRLLFCLQCSGNKYEYRSTSNDVIDAIAGNEDEFFKRVFVKINDLPEWMHESLYNLRKKQLEEEKRTEDELKKQEIKKQKKLELKRKIFPFLKSE